MKAKTSDKIWTIVFYIVSFLISFLLVAMFAYILLKGKNAFNPKFLFGTPKFGASGGGIGLQLFNSFYMLIISLVLTVPLGVGAGIYLAEYAKEGMFLNIIRLCIETMASLPSIVVGLFGFLVLVNMTKWGFTLFSGALVITILNLPSLTRVTEDAIRSSSKLVKEASLGLGATRWQTIKRVILPSAFPQILTGVILASGRIFGESAALLYTAGMSAPPLNFSSAALFTKSSPFNIFRPAETLSVYIWKLNTEGIVPDAAQIAAGAAAVLIVMVIIFNVLSRIIGNKVYKKFSGES
ncbi:phosphate ABC transporter membrane protein 2, PhoT family (TC 3.A.1.7.1) [Clostridium collagenovorans DSM 3089]|uniref:Phosphate transport system permease protein PstA n=1 Tax=Clostridium collagenovorans DSM 3089 TaxID=1121306 RepID=A0A1M5SQP7_9CLOT|nr:phosphate ABC transporter permease PstA [Clostridium collagenovorans]SHH40825.1 phosphate ABC transporter membrane protein 2, PhoT family (TC 3.A.1.7.1) [Clostridium collagenovorans DSM 3089]